MLGFWLRRKKWKQELLSKHLLRLKLDKLKMKKFVLFKKKLIEREQKMQLCQLNKNELMQNKQLYLQNSYGFKLLKRKRRQLLKKKRRQLRMQRHRQLLRPKQQPLKQEHKQPLMKLHLQQNNYVTKQVKMKLKQ